MQNFNCSVSSTRDDTTESLFSCAKTLYDTTFVHLNNSVYHGDAMVEAFKGFYSLTGREDVDEPPTDIWTWLTYTEGGHSGLPRSFNSIPIDPSYPYFKNIGARFVEGLPERMTSAFNLVNDCPVYRNTCLL